MKKRGWMIGAMLLAVTCLPASVFAEDLSSGVSADAQTIFADAQTADAQMIFDDVQTADAQTIFDDMQTADGQTVFDDLDDLQGMPALFEDTQTAEEPAEADGEAAQEELQLFEDNTISLQAAETVVYNLNQRGVFKGRTKKKIIDTYADLSSCGKTYIEGYSPSYYKTPGSWQKPFKAGMITKDTTLAMQGMTDFYRWLVGVAPLTRKTSPAEDLQVGALVRNYEFAHVISPGHRPAGMSKAMWNRGASVSHGILAYNYTPTGSIYGWINEGYQNQQWNTLGHRYALLSSSVSEVQFGYSGAVGIGRSTYENTFTEDCFAFPSPGYMPAQLISAYSAAWSIDFHPDFVYADNPDKVKVKITNRKTKKSVVRKTADDTLIAADSSLQFAQPEIKDLYYSGTYDVKITGLKDVATGKAAEVNYTITFFSLDLPTVENAKITGIGKKTYTGKALKPLVVKYKGKKLTQGKDYDVIYQNNKNVGMALAVIVGKGGYGGRVYQEFAIVPKGTSVSKAAPAKKAVTVSWKKQRVQTGGYQIQYSTSKNFPSAKSKLVIVKGNKKVSKKITGLKAKTTYYVRVRTFKKIDGTYYCSCWSAAKKVTTK